MNEIGGTMIAKKFTKKLSLNKETLANLDTEAMNQVKGGDQVPFTWTCRTRCPLNCI